MWAASRAFTTGTAEASNWSFPRVSMLTSDNRRKAFRSSSATAAHLPGEISMSPFVGRPCIPASKSLSGISCSPILQVPVRPNQSRCRDTATRTLLAVNRPITSKRLTESLCHRTTSSPRSTAAPASDKRLLISSASEIRQPHRLIGTPRFSLSSVASSRARCTSSGRSRTY